LQKTKVVLDALGYPDVELSILITDDKGISELNEKYLQRKGPTNVIAFPMREGRFTQIMPNLLGDIVISADAAKRESKIAKIDFQIRFFELLIHGILHLLGYDHVKDEKDAFLMENKSRELLKMMNDAILHLGRDK